MARTLDPPPATEEWSAAYAAPTSAMGAFMFFGAVLFATIAIAVKCKVTGEKSAFNQVKEKKAAPLDFTSFGSVYTLLFNLTVLGLILFYAYICEYHPPYAPSEKTYDRDHFWFVFFLLLVVSAFTLKKNHAPPIVMPGSKKNKADKEVKAAASENGHQHAALKTKDSNLIDSGLKSEEEQELALVKSTLVASKKTDSDLDMNGGLPVHPEFDVMNRQQTEEWKGWMQFIFLLYHYYSAAEGYNPGRSLISCYVWMTGFGNISFFMMRRDYSLMRVLQMLWRINFLVIFLCLTQGTTFILYYVCFLHTYYFVVVYVTMIFMESNNYSRYFVRIKIAILAIFIYMVWDFNHGLFRVIHRPFLGETPQVGAVSGQMWEWYFRSSLDCYATINGMIFGLQYPITSLFFRKLDEQVWYRQWASKLAPMAIFAYGAYWWWQDCFSVDKVTHNARQSYVSFIPLYGYVWLRNLTPWMRSHTLTLLQEIGTTSLETYLMQHHIWLSNDAKALLVLLPGYPKINFLWNTIIFFICSRKLFRLTIFLRGMVVPQTSRNECLRNLGIFYGTILIFVFSAYGLDAIGQLNLGMVGVFALVGGIVMYKLVDHFLFPTNSGQPAGVSSSSTHSSSSSKGGFMGSVGGMLIAATVLLSFGGVWEYMAYTGSSKILPLPPHCEEFVQVGDWIQVDPCNEAARGTSYRIQDMATLGTCYTPGTELYLWGWEPTPPESRCRLVQRSGKKLKAILNHRNLTYIGDTTVRQLYFGMGRALGDASAGAYNTSVDNSEPLSSTYGAAALEFRWAPYMYSMVDMIKAIKKEAVLPSAVIIGGGLYDRQYNYKDQVARDAVADTATTLAGLLKELKQMGVLVIWSVPPMINNAALDPPNMINVIGEGEITKIRDVQVDKGVLDAATFVLDGPTYSHTRVLESYDGIRYPLSVYDAPTQVLANSFDWLFPEGPIKDEWIPPTLDVMGNTTLGLIMVAAIFICLFCFDGFYGLGYVAAIFTPSAAPFGLYDEARAERMGLFVAAGGASRSEKTSLLAEAEQQNGESSDDNNVDSGEVREAFQSAKGDGEPTLRTV